MDILENGNIAIDKDNLNFFLKNIDINEIILINEGSVQKPQ